MEIFIALTDSLTLVPRFIGFGYLMTFMKNYGLGAVCFTMLITALGIQWYVFCESFFHQIFHGQSDSSWHHVDFTIYSLLNALFGISAVLISFGAVIGKVRPFQLMIMAFIELIFHALNYEWILIGGLKTADVGGTFADHMFGAYFGLAVSMVLNRNTNAKDRAEPAMGYNADIFSLIGTLFLWIYWPSFVGGGAVADSAAQNRAILNTILALSASTIAAFACSSIFSTHSSKVFRPVDIQNATLAGGVAIGCIANFQLNPVNAIFVGSAAGIVSTFGFNRIQGFLFRTIGLHDTCGVHNLHGMPSVIGGIASIILAAYKQTDGRDNDRDVFTALGDAGDQSWRQLVSILLVITCAIVSGVFAGLLMNYFDPAASAEDNLVREHDDSTAFEVAADYKYEGVPIVDNASEGEKEREVDPEFAAANDSGAVTSEDVHPEVDAMSQ